MVSDAGYLAENGPADLVIFADKEKRQVTADFKSKAANSPFVEAKSLLVVLNTRSVMVRLFIKSS